DGRGGQAGLVDEASGGGEGLTLEKVVYAQGRPRPVAFPGNTLPVRLEQIDNAGCRIECLIGRSRHAVQKEFQPGFPGPMSPNLLQESVVVGAMGLQIEAEIEERAPQYAMDAEKERDQQSPAPTVAVQEWVDGLELDMEQPGLQERGQSRLSFMQEYL